MRKIIDGKSYDTDTAKLIGCQDNGDYGSFDFMSESLYRKRTGEYFVHGEGGARSRYAESQGSGWWSNGEKIIPLDFASASSWAERHLTTAEYESEFGGAREDEKQLISLRISASAYAKLSKLVSMQGQTKSAIVEGLIANA